MSARLQEKLEKQIEENNKVIWKSEPLLNSWKQSGSEYSDVGFYKDKMGFVHLKGGVKSGKPKASIFDLPKGYRPSTLKTFSIHANTGHGRLDITSAGSIQAFGPYTWLSLDGMTFHASE